MTRNDPRLVSNTRNLERRLLRQLGEWYESQRSSLRRGQVAVGVANTGLVVIEHFRTTYPLTEEDYLSPGRGQVSGLSGPGVRRILTRFGETRSLGTEAGRTSRGTPRAARDLAERFNALRRQLSTLSSEDRNRLADSMQRWLLENPIREFFERQRLEVELDPRLPIRANVAAILQAAQGRKQAGPVAQHLVGAKLQLRFPRTRIPNYSVTTADTPSQRRGDFELGNAVFHVTVAPGEAVIRKCHGDLSANYRPVLLVPDSSVAAASQMAENVGLGRRLWIASIESFVGQNVEEIAEFDGRRSEGELRALLELYNRRVQEVERDTSLLIDIPGSLGRNRPVPSRRRHRS